MSRWVALLRGVNVGGASIRSAELAACLTSSGLADVRTVLATGNAVFSTPDDADLTDDGAHPDSGPAQVAALKARIEAALSQRFGYTAWIVLVALEDLAALAAGYPFERREGSHHPYVVFTSDAEVLAELGARAHELASHDVERVDVAGDVLYWECPKGSSTDTPFAKALASSRYRPTTTTRNLRTVEKILTAAAR